MYIESVKNIESEDLHNGEEIVKVSKKVLIGEKQGAPNFKLRLFTVEPGGHTPWHTHDWEHQNYFISGKGILVSKEGEQEVKPDMVSYVAPGEKHQFKNPYDKPFIFLCLIPLK